ncbi:hypothetical protein PLESTB_000466100 [Pleodorina starrii]|uniref:HIRAN domain-containing protein n=1 Tax=Pleodorina starrii TaxID=330485 RepID=A0A9W6EZT4_9CHLO|nr:hypothetical protein PLESTM_000800600 [Pleodorina starrii]GLC51102.1 hypothetical protein PLESTB_000466100 [Pleodorina starrii]GLC63460.1 hypothetical protein PLESTF_000038600 [Pleodorina starrii]
MQQSIFCISKVAFRCSSVTHQGRRNAAVFVKAHLPSPSDTSKTAPLFAGRKSFEDKVPLESFSIAGVTFEGRQELIRELQPDQIVYLEREPWNQHDPLAVRVMNLDGRTLGYIPRRDGLNAKFTYEGTFGLIASVGPAKDSLQYGARLYARPKLGSLLLDPLVLPSVEAARLTDMNAVFGALWPAVLATTLAAAEYRCEVTGITQAQLPLELTPHWRYNAREMAVQLTRLVGLCQPVAAAKARLEQAIAGMAGEDASAAAAALQELQASPDGQLFTEINGLAEQDAVQYFELVRRRAHMVEAERWRVEVLL